MNYVSVLRPQLAAHAWRIGQERLQSAMEIDRLTRQSAQQPLKDDPPRIVYSDSPALLVPIEGEPVLRPFADTGLLRVTNTRALLLQDSATSRYYLFVSDRWMQSKRLEGPWSDAARVSAQLEQARQAALQEDRIDLLQPDRGPRRCACSRRRGFTSAPRPRNCCKRMARHNTRRSSGPGCST